MADLLPEYPSRFLVGPEREIQFRGWQAVSLADAVLGLGVQGSYWLFLFRNRKSSAPRLVSFGALGIGGGVDSSLDWGTIKSFIMGAALPYQDVGPQEFSWKDLEGAFGTVRSASIGVPTGGMGALEVSAWTLRRQLFRTVFSGASVSPAGGKKARIGVQAGSGVGLWSILDLGLRNNVITVERG